MFAHSENLISFLYTICFGGSLFGFIVVLADLLLRWAISQDPSQKMICNQWTTRFIVCCALPSSSFLVIFLNKSTILKIFAFAVMTIYFIVASLTDIETRQVYDFLFYIAVLAGIPLLLSQNQSPRSMVSLLLFCFLQLFFFSKMYGKADVMAFIVSALFETIQGGDFIIYILHMAITFTFLAIVQIIRGNINNKGNLKHPVAFLPYISLTIWPFLL